MANLFDSPPALAGSEAEQMLQMYRYLQQMSEQLNETMDGLSFSGFTPEAQEQIRTMTAAGTKKEIDGTRNALRSLIIKTADIVRTEMDEIRTELVKRTDEMSEDFGQRTAEMQLGIEANAEGIAQNYSYYETLNGKTNGYDGFVTRMSERIFSGVIGYDANDMPIFGIAVGEGVTAYDADNNPVINQNAKMATFTKERMSFWMGNTEIAYFGNRKLFITNAEVLRKMTMGNYVWRVQSDNSLGLMVEIQATT